MLLYYGGSIERRSIIAAAIADAGMFHDLGKLDPSTQEELRRGRGAGITWDHVDAGIAHLQAGGAEMAAWLVRAHHAPGLPSRPHHFTRRTDRRLRGRRDDALEPARHMEQTRRTDAHLPTLLAEHRTVLGPWRPTPTKALHGLVARLALSCLVDADHGDTAAFDAGWKPPAAPQPRWRERLVSLDAYVANLGSDSQDRDQLRRAFYTACRHGGPDASLVACEGPVGIGKTTAVIAYLLRRAIVTDARRLIVVAPFTGILSQTASRLRKALVLPDEADMPDAVVAEHHHRADFEHPTSRDLATLWAAPIILTTSVQFFETLSSATPSALRKLHALPGSVIFLDEAHAALPVSGSRLMPSTGNRVETPILLQNWRWMRQLARHWSCSFVFASGSLPRFWTIDNIVGDTREDMPYLGSKELVAPLLAAEATRVRYVSLPRIDGPAALVQAVMSAPGPRLLIMNTVQSAAVMAKRMRAAGHDVLHLSSALCPRDRAPVLEEVARRLQSDEGYPANWTLIATSLMEAGVDVSFRTSFRERYGTISLIQIGGRTNRNSEWLTGLVHDFTVAFVEGLTEHPEARGPADVLGRLFAKGAFDGLIDPAALVTTAMQWQIRRQRGMLVDHLGEAERDARYPDVMGLGRIIDADTRLVVVDRALRDLLADGARIAGHDILSGSVQIWSTKIESFGLEPIPGRDGIYWWPFAYDPAFLGYMAGALEFASFATGGLNCI